MTALASLARVLPSGEKAIGPNAPGRNRISFQLDVSQTLIPPSRLVVARRGLSPERATGAELSGKDFRSVQSAVFHKRVVPGLAVRSVLPSGKKARDKPPFGRVATSALVRTSRRLTRWERPM